MVLSPHGFDAIPAFRKQLSPFPSYHYGLFALFFSLLPFVFNRFRTLFAKCRGYGGSQDNGRYRFSVAGDKIARKSFIYRIYADLAAKCFIYRIYAKHPGGGVKPTS